MAATNCPRCHKLFNKISSPVCPLCEKEEEEKFQELCEYIHETPGTTLAQASEATGVSARRIMKYIREGRLIIPEGMMSEVRCTKCGNPIVTGSFCESCAAKLANEFSSGVGFDDPKLSKTISRGMHIRS